MTHMLYNPARSARSAMSPKVSPRLAWPLGQEKLGTCKPSRMMYFSPYYDGLVWNAALTFIELLYEGEYLRSKSAKEVEAFDVVGEMLI